MSTKIKRIRYKDTEVIGKKFGELTIISRLPDRQTSRHKIFLCKCSCETEYIAKGTCLITGKTWHCGCKNKVDWTGKKVGRWTVIGFAGYKIYKTRKILAWNCICSCEDKTQKIVNADVLSREDSQSCGCLSKELHSKLFFKDISGQKFGSLLVINRSENRGRKRTAWNCLCPCGRIFPVLRENIISGNTNNCGVCFDYKKYKKRCKAASNKRSLSIGYNASIYKAWRKSVFKRDRYKCVICGKKYALVAHHKDGWHWCVNRRYDTDNGVTLCSNKNGCHRIFHRLYGNKNNTEFQFNEFYNKYKDAKLRP